MTVVQTADFRTEAALGSCVIFRIYCLLAIESLFNLFSGARKLMRLALIPEFDKYMMESRLLVSLTAFVSIKNLNM